MALKVCFIGIGSIAKRHVRNLRCICDERGIKLRIDAYRRSQEFAEGIDNIYTDIDSVPDDYDAVFITNP